MIKGELKEFILKRFNSSLSLIMMVNVGQKWSFSNRLNFFVFLSATIFFISFESARREDSKNVFFDLWKICLSYAVQDCESSK